jgi:adenylate cyclase
MLFRFFRILRNISLPVIGILITCLIGLCYIYQPYFVRFLDNKFYDVILRRNHSQKTSQLVEIVDIDEKSLDEFGQWPWPRYRVALLLQKLREAGARAVGMDILFSEADRSSPKILQQSLKKDLGVEIGFSNLPDQLEDNDTLLASILAQGPFVLGFYFDFDGTTYSGETSELKPIPVSIVSKNSADKQHFSLMKASQAIVPLPILSRAAPATGYINAIKDRDGILRATPVLIEHRGSYYANLGLATLWAGLQKPSMILKINENGIESLRFGQSVIPLDRNGRFTLHFRGKNRTFRYHSASDVLNGTVGEEELRGKLLLIGTSAAGLKDLRTTPLDTYFPGVEAQATLMDNIIVGDFIKAPDWVPGLELLVTIFAGLFVLSLTYLVRTMIVLPTVATLALACWFGSEWIFSNHHFFVSPLFPMANLIATFSMLTFIGMYRTEHDKAYIRQAFSRYVAPSLVDRIAEHPEQLNLDGEEKEVTIMFSDVRGFTSLSEKLNPTDVTTLINQYLTPVTRLIRAHQGTLDKYIGDAVMAFWNAPLDVANHHQQAVEAGLGILKELPALNEVFRERFGVEIAVGIGLHAGQVRVGNMGSDDLFDYTILGDNVNLTSRIEGLTRFYGVDIIISETLQHIAIAGYRVQELDTVRVKGKAKPVTLFTYRDLESSSESEMSLWGEGLALYKHGAFAEAVKPFEALLADHPDETLYQIYLERCRKNRDNPPDDWDPIFSHLSK